MMMLHSIDHVARRIPFFRLVVAFRAVWLIAALLTVEAVAPLGTPVLVTAAAAIAGVVAGSLLAATNLRTRGFLTVLALMWLGSAALLRGAAAAIAGGEGYFLRADAIALHVNTCLLLATLGALSSWFFWRVRLAVTIEALGFIALAVAIFATHREFHLDRPKFITAVAWRWGVDPLVVLLCVGCALLGAAVSYLCLASAATRPKVDRTTVQRAPAGRQLIPTTLVVTLLVAAVWGVQQLVYSYFYERMLTRVSNGVGMSSGEGVSPLNFQSALGSSSQPAALVRLEGDYSGNPFSPLLFLRENALSTLSGNELVSAGRGFDSDLPTIRPQDAYKGSEDASLAPRTPVVHSVYLIADHKLTFSLDYPVSIVQLRNPRPARFRAAYRVYSVAPAFSPAELAERSVGDPRWSPDVRQHYLQTHPDPRYAELAREITKDATTPIEQASAITEWLIKSAIYTLKPNHDVPPDGDHTAAFLFGDKRGYCVHFAHAATYMLRSLGIPARVGTGYLTDLSQAKDGHILLRLTDRHAWAEVYVTNLGWVPFDVQPEQIEDHADSQVDAKMLEELMGVLEPGEELLPTDPIKNEPGMTDESPVELPEPRTLLLAAVAVLGLGLVLKMLLLHGWRIAPTRRMRLRASYLAALARLHDLGITRQRGETHLTFAQRTPHQGLTELTRLILTQRYAPHNRPPASRSEVLAASAAARRAIGSLPRWRRLLAILNPASTLRFLGGRLW